MSASPTNTRVPPAAQDPQRFAHSLPQTTTAAPFTPPLSSGPSQSLHDTTPLQTPVATVRQDSAFSHLRYDASKETEPSLPSSVFAFSYFHPAVGSRRQSNTSRPISHPAGPSSPHSPPGESRSNQQPAEAGAPSVKRAATSQSLSSGTPPQAETATSPDQLRGPDTGFRNPLPSPTSDHVNGSGRHQRYNVRFNTVYTSENMPPNQKPRHDPAPTAPMAAETNEEQSAASEQTITPSVEPATSPANSAPPSLDDQNSLDQQNEPKLERCKGCNEPWRRPLPGEEQYRLSSPAQNMGEQIKLTEDLIKRLENHTKFADEAYAAWQRRHRWCPASPPSTDGNPPVDPPSKSAEEPSPTATPAQPVSAKRKSEIPHDASSKIRKIVSFDPPSNPTHPVRPTAPA